MNEKERILVVDDSAISLATVEQHLRDKYEVVCVNSGARAIRYLRMEEVSLILLDIQMGAKDGIQTLREIRELKNGRDVPVIMLTSKGNKETIIETTKLGICDYVLKPFSAEDLRERIQRTLHNVKESNSQLIL